MPPISDVLRMRSRNMDNFRREWIVLHRVVAEDPEVCPCGKQGIKELCWIKNVLTEDEFFIGNCCVRFLADKGYCAKCEIYPVISHSAHYCEACAHGRKDAPTGFVEKGNPLYGKPIKNLTYEEAMVANPDYAKYILKTPSTWKYNDPHYLAWLRLQKQRVAVGVGVRQENGKLSL